LAGASAAQPDAVTRRRIALVIHSLQMGGMERVMSELANEFARRGHDVHVVLFGIHRDVFYTLEPAIVLHRPGFDFDNRKRLISTLRTLWFVRQCVRSLRPWAALSFGQYWNSFVLLALAGTGTPVFISDRSQPDKALSRLQEILRRLLYPRATGIIAQTNYARSFMARSIGHRNIGLIPNPVREIAAGQTAPRERMVLTVGRLIKTKHHDELIKTFLCVAPPDWRLVIIGDDALKQNNRLALEALIREHRAEQRVELAGARKDVDDFYRRASIFAFTSSSEGFPNVIAEAQSAGLPVVAFDCVAGPSELIRDGENGFLVKLFDYVTFGQRISALIEQSELRERLGAAAQSSIKSLYVPAIASRYLDFFAGSLQGPDRE
jgi:GalNAc-alpha-(1->4)-GalNAc-alpha-(1->3)-diNAcBac-PP-undecaprenol alpha-1,4-N-acetyl-D-galactosaminyltransferase